MLKFFHAPDGLTLKANVRFPEIVFRGSNEEKARQGFIPFSHIYLTSASQLAHFRRFAEPVDSLVTLPDQTAATILEHRRCPVNLSFDEAGISAVLTRTGLEDRDSISIAIVNGMGRGYGDNLAGLGALQHLRRFLETRYKRVTIDILQRNAGIQSVIYQRHSTVDGAHQLPISVTRFYRYDCFADLSDLLSISVFNELPLYDFFLRALSLQKEVTKDVDKRTVLELDGAHCATVRERIRETESDDAARKVVMIHPDASTPLRSMPPTLVQRIIKALRELPNVALVTCCDVNSEHVIDLREMSGDINSFFDVIGCCDVVLTVGTVTYHVSGNLEVPTLLFPTVRADVVSASNLRSVECYLPDASKPYISDKHMSRHVEDIERSSAIWDNVDVDEVVRFVREAE